MDRYAIDEKDKPFRLIEDLSEYEFQDQGNGKINVVIKMPLELKPFWAHKLRSLTTNEKEMAYYE